MQSTGTDFCDAHPRTKHCGWKYARAPHDTHLCPTTGWVRQPSATTGFPSPLFCPLLRPLLSERFPLSTTLHPSRATLHVTAPLNIDRLDRRSAECSRDSSPSAHKEEPSRGVHLMAPGTQQPQSRTDTSKLGLKKEGHTRRSRGEPQRSSCPLLKQQQHANSSSVEPSYHTSKYHISEYNFDASIILGIIHSRSGHLISALISLVPSVPLVSVLCNEPLLIEQNSNCSGDVGEITGVGPALRLSLRKP